MSRLPAYRQTPRHLLSPGTNLQENTPETSNGRRSSRQHGVGAADAHFDLVIIGAGPAALALISRIFESRPAALYTEDEHRHLHFLNRSTGSSLRRNGKTPSLPQSHVNIGECGCDGTFKVLVIDKVGEGFLGLWRRLFDAFGISHLRSPMYFHPDASDFKALRSFADNQGMAEEGDPEDLVHHITNKVLTAQMLDGDLHPSSLQSKRDFKSKQSRTKTSESPVRGIAVKDLIEIPAVVGKNISKHRCKQARYRRRQATATSLHVNERDRKDYFTPSARLFDHFINQLSRRYCPSTLLGAPKESWPEVSSFCVGESKEKVNHHPITTVRGIAKDVVWCDGTETAIYDQHGMQRPGFCLSLADSSSQNTAGPTISALAVVSAVGSGGVPNIPSFLTLSMPGTASDPGWTHSSALAYRPFPQPSIVSEHQSTILIVGGGLTSAQLVIRALEKGYSKVILLIRGQLKCKAFDVDLEWVGKYRNYLKMQFWQEEDAVERIKVLKTARGGGSVTPTYAKILRRLQDLGLLEVLTHTEIRSASFHEGQGWSMRLSRRQRHQDAEQEFSLTNVDHLLLATGSKQDFDDLRFLERARTDYPIEVVEGMPVISEHLEYQPDIPLFFTGAFAGLQIGPGAGNLGGMREAADRIASRLEHLIQPPSAALPGRPRPRDKGDESETKHEQPTKSSTNSLTHFNFDLLSLEA